MNKSEKITDMRQTLIKKIIIITDKIKNKYGLKSKNLNYNSQIFTLTLTSLFFHSTSSNIKCLLRATAVLFLLDQIHSVGLLLLLLLLLGLLLLDSPLSSSDFYFFVFARLALYPLRFLMNYVDCISVFVNCGLLAFIGLVCLLFTVVSCHVWTIDLVGVCGFGLRLEY